MNNTKDAHDTLAIEYYKNLAKARLRALERQRQQQVQQLRDSFRRNEIYK